MSGRAALRHAPALLVAALFVVPLLLMLSGSLRGVGLPPPRGLEVLPADPSVESFRRLFALLPVGRYLLNSLVVVTLAVPLTVLVASLAGYGIRLLSRTGRRAVLLACVALLTVPAAVLWTSRFEVYASLRLTDSLLPLVAPALLGTSPLFVLLYAWAFSRLPGTQLEAARLEGASALRTWWSVALPQVRPVTLAVAVLAFTAHWGSFVDALLYLRAQELFTLPAGLRTLQLLGPTDFPVLLAGAVVATVPAVLAVVLGQRLFLDDALTGQRSRRAR
jgi:multiple sugar transport system permease protein